ncbi:MAG: HAMP domain-containing sensor histidine kinase [Planctomycetota bacterium]|nr:HAMP domain-containing sensor histidine kinase [Planctomycetota bacterium]
MSLHTRFLLLLGLLGAAVIANIGVTVWTVGLLDREQRRPVEQIGSALGVLNDTKRILWDQAGEFGLFVIPGRVAEATPGEGRTFSPERVRKFRVLGEKALERISDLDDIDASLVRAGVNTAANLRSRITRVNSGFETYLDNGDEATWQSSLGELYTLHEFIERLEARLIHETRLSAAHGAQMQQRLMATLISSIVSVVIVLLAAAWLFRRWVLVRVSRLGVAAERIGRGEFDHRVEVQGNDELDRVGQQINDMTQTIKTMQAERIDRERLAAIGDMGRRLAHNIRNPLGGIRSLAELSTLELDEASPVREHQQRIIRTVDQFTRWLQDLLSVSNPLAVSIAEVVVEPWLTELVESHRALAESRGITLTLDTADAPTAAPFDRGHLEHVVSALITNAIQACSRGGAVQVKAVAESSDWSLSVLDDGAGIQPEHLQSMFAPYFTTKPGGTGIGLAQAKRVVMQHGGRIWAENRGESGLPGFGAALHVELPLRSRAKMAMTGQSNEADCGQNTPA